MKTNMHYGNISLNYSHDEICFRQKLYIKDTHFMFSVEKYGRARQATDDNITRRMRFACRTIMARIQTHTRGICNTYCLFMATVVTRAPLYGTLYVHCLSCNTVLPSKPWSGRWSLYTSCSPLPNSCTHLSALVPRAPPLSFLII
jgi:hypothetical protein